MSRLVCCDNPGCPSQTSSRYDLGSPDTWFSLYYPSGWRADWTTTRDAYLDLCSLVCVADVIKRLSNGPVSTNDDTPAA